ncbi:MAG: hypothetical protein JWP35_2990 [Caulobacter sp.]|nr:hypothetical protein [Caulobacter sp.]
MSEIKKFSQLYDTAEDRMAWDTEDADGETTRLWLTRRMCQGLAGAVVAMLQKKEHAAAEHESVLQAWEQVAAMAGFGNTAPVQPKPEMAVGLVTAVHLAPSAKGVSMTFDFGAGEHRSIGLTYAAIRQTLSVMHRLYVAAGWPTEVWPDWVADPEASAAVPADSVN